MTQVLEDRYRHLVFSGVLSPAFRAAWGAPGDFDPWAQGHRRLGALTESIPNEKRAFLSLVTEHAGVDCRRYRPGPLLRRIPACLRAVRVASITSAMARLRDEPECWPLVIDALLIGVTSFFRDAYIFDALRRLILPPFLTRLGRGLQAWSVGCSDGAELYSLGILLAEQRVLDRSRLLGTDCRRSAIARARLGSYPTSVLAPIPTELHTHLLPDAAGVCVSPPLRAATHWLVSDALRSHRSEEFDLIMCRNLAIYLDPAAAAALWLRLGRALRPGGLLIVGRAERPHGRFKRLSRCVFEKPEGRS